ncbi:hypothetical protein EYS14_19835 [Alteromonadaceae bacterium M269]|nr:hypothetical protein EYS14_19835 [Alteromonadaceae bacterium M269]
MFPIQRIKKLALLIVVTAIGVAGCTLSDYARLSISQSITKPEWENASHVTQVPFKLIDHKILIPISVNGSKPLDFVLDTGSPVTVVVESHTTKNLELNPKGNISVGGLGDDGDSTAGFLHNSTIKVGELSIGDKSLIHIPLTSLPFFDDLDEVFFDGIVGYDLLDNFVLKIDYDSSIITLYERKRFDQSEYVSNGWFSVPLEIAGAVPYIQSDIQLSEDTAPIKLTLHLDTGANGAIALAPRAHEEIRFPSTYYSSTSQGLSGSLKNRNGLVTKTRLGDVEFTNLLGSFSDSAITDQHKHQGAIGNELFSKFNVVFDYQGKQMLLKKNHRFELPIEPDRSGLGLLTHKKGYIVKRINDDSSAAKSSLTKGDIITSFDGTPATPENIETLRLALSSKQESLDLCWLNQTEEKCDSFLLEDRMKLHDE